MLRESSREAFEIGAALGVGHADDVTRCACIIDWKLT